MNGLIAELRRRNIFRVAGAYAVVGWLLAQASGVMEAAFNLPDWFDTIVVALVLLGFPLAMVLAWAFEMTPEGVRRTSAVDPDDSIARKTGRKLEYAILLGLVLVVVVVVGDRFMPERSAAPAATQTAEAGEASIAVLPFSDLSPEGDQGYFADGLSEELLNVLAQSPDLRVAGRTSSFAFKGDNRDLREIGQLLNVSHILEGSVRKSGERIRVTAQLIEASNGYHVFSETYDRDLTDIFAVQDDIAGRIGAELRAELSAGAAAGDSAPQDVEAFDLYLQARELIYTRQPDNLARAHNLLDRALALDPAYAPAYAQKATATVLQVEYSGAPPDEALPTGLALARRAVALGPDSAEAHAVLGLALQASGGDLEESGNHLRRALEINPSLTDARNWLRSVLQGRRDPAMLELTETTFARDPLYPPGVANLVSSYIGLGRLNDAQAVLDRASRLGVAPGLIAALESQISSAQGRLAEAERQAEAASGFATQAQDIYAAVLIDLGDYDRALEYGSASIRPLIMALAGRRDEAAEAFAEIPPPNSSNSSPLTRALQAGPLLDLDAATIAYAESVPAVLAAQRRDYEALALGPLAALYRRAGRQADADALTADMAEAVSALQALSEDALRNTPAPAELAALRGDREAALEALEEMMDRGAAGVTLLISPALDPLRGNPRFQAVEAENQARVNTEREKLGLAPLDFTD